MKATKFFAMALAALTLFSCSKENNIENPIPADQKATLKLSLTGKGGQTKATGATTQDVAVNDLIAFVFRADGSLDALPKYMTAAEITAASGNVEIAISKGAAEVYVVANTGELATSPVKGVTNKASLLTKVGDLANGTATTQDKDNLWMVGKENVDWTDAELGKATVALSFVAAKVEFVVDLTALTNTTDNCGYIDIKDVVLLYAGREAKFFGTAAQQATQAKWYSGDVSYPNIDVPEDGVNMVQKDFLVQSVTFNGGGAMTTVNPHFYTFPNDGAAKPTILALRGTRNEKDEDGDMVEKTYYWPIQFSAADAQSTLEAGKSYTVTIKLKGDTTYQGDGDGSPDSGNGGGNSGGTEDPETEIVPADVEVSITPAAWVPVPTIEKGFE